MEPRDRRSKDIPALTGLRFVAAAYVVLFHTWPIFMPSRPGGLYWNQFVSLGYTAVSFFFVLSGFILATVYPKTESSAPLDRRAFWQARFARIYPIYAVSMLVSAPFALANRAGHEGVYRIGKAIFLCVTNGTLLQAWHPALSGNWNRPSWSVSVEAFFYLVFPVLGAWVYRYRARLLLLIAGFWMSSLATSMVCLSLLPVSMESLPKLEILLFNPILRLPEFLTGICFAALMSRGGLRPVPRIALVGVLPGLLLVPLLVRLPWLVVSNGLLSPLFGIVILSVATSGGRVVRLLQTPILVRLGHASFSMYLLHYPVLFWMTYLLKTGTVTAKLEGPWPILADSPAYLAAYLSLVIALALASYSLIESPARRQIRAWLSRPRDTKQVKSEVDAQAIAG